MLPALRPGDWIVATDRLHARAGDVVVVEHPRRPGFWLVKRVGALDGGLATVSSDNADAPTVDSRAFGPVDADALFRVVLRYWPPGRVTFSFRRRPPSR